MNTIHFPPLPLEGTLSFHVANCILEAITEGTLQPGAKLPPEATLEDLFGVGRNAVRDAVKILVSSGFLTIRRGEGTFVQDQCTYTLIAPLMFELIWEDLCPTDFLDFSLACIYAHLRLSPSPDVASLRRIAAYLEQYDRFVEDFSFPPTEEQVAQYWALRSEFVFGSSQNLALLDLCGSEFSCLTMCQWDLRAIFTEEAQWKTFFRLDRRDMEIIQTGDRTAVDRHMEELRAFWNSALHGVELIPTRPEIIIPGKEANKCSSFRRVYQRLLWDTFRRIYPPGSRLPTELEFSHALGVSRNTLREVIKCLEAIGVITIARGDGMYVSLHRTWQLTIDDRIFEKILTPSDHDSLYALRAAVRQGLSYLEPYRTGKPNTILSYLDAIFTRLLASP